MKSFNQELKSALVAEIRKHREQDQVIQGTYGTFEDGRFRGCAVGCAIHSYLVAAGEDSIVVVVNSEYHDKYESLFGIPKILAELQDVIHEGLSDESFPTWPERFMEAVPTETELSLVFPKFAWWLIVHPVVGMIEHAQDRQTMGEMRNAAGVVATAGIGKIPVPQEEWITKSHYLLKGCRTDKAAQVVGQLLRACSPVGIRQDIDRAIVGAAVVLCNYFDCNEQFYEKCAEKLIELLKAEGNG